MNMSSRDSAADAASHRSSFFRQSGWLMIANIGTGVFMWAVHFLSKVTGPAEYGTFVAFLAVAMILPTLPLQMVLAQQTARALATGRTGELSTVIRLMWGGTTALWLVGAVLAVVFQQNILARWKLQHPQGLWLTLGIVLLSLWMPIFWGVLQGSQRFLWLGWSMIVNGVARLLLAGLAVFLGARAAGMLGGVLLGLAVASYVAIWQSRDLWRAPALRFDWVPLLKQVLPLLLAIGAFQIFFTGDTIFAKAIFDEEVVGFYGIAGTMARALLWLVGPMAAVMFPRLVHSAARAEKSNLMNLVFLGTGLLALVGAAAVSVLGPWLVRFVSAEKFVAVASALLPWYAFAMVPLALSNVLLNNLMALGDYRCVPLLVPLAAGYCAALAWLVSTPVQMLQTMGTCNLLMLSVCALFTWVLKRKPATTPSTG